MRFRDVIITKERFVANIEDLSSHPNVKKCWRFPNGNVLFEFYHPIFEITMEGDPEKRKKLYDVFDEKQALLVVEADKVMHQILEPLYKLIPRDSDQVMLGDIAGGDPTATRYSFLGVGKGKEFPSKWRNLFKFVMVGKKWWEARHFKLIFELNKRDKSNLKKLEEVLRDWEKSGREQGRDFNLKLIQFSNSLSQVECSFNENCSDAIEVLYMMLTDTRKETLVQSVDMIVE